MLRNVSNYNQTFVLVKTFGGNIIGGYNPEPWVDTSDSSWEPLTNSSYIFYFTSNGS